MLYSQQQHYITGPSVPVARSGPAAAQSAVQTPEPAQQQHHGEAQGARDIQGEGAPEGGELGESTRWV